jgi:RHS repeat-associated protein
VESEASKANSPIHYNYWRDGYDSTVGRYTQSDPLGLIGVNTFSYVDGDPVAQSDPLGLDAIAELNKAGWGVPPVSPSPYPILRDTWQEMKNKAVTGTDQFFHCLGTCRAKTNGSTVGDIRGLTTNKEYLRDYPLGRLGLYGTGQVQSHREMMDDIARDQAANEQGLACPSNLTCNQQCSSLLDKLPPNYRPFMQKYRTVW